MSNYNYLFAALLAGTLASNSARAERILINDIEQTVTLSRALDCYSTPDIRINTSRPEIFAPESTQLQAVTDTARAMLSYECPGLSQINVTGSVRGLGGIIYRGELLARSNWLVQSNSLATADTQEHYERTASWSEPQYIARSNHRSANGALSITGIELGMSVEEVSTIISEKFQITPQYDTESGLMTMQAGGCPTNINLSRDADSATTNWKCLKAWFSDQRVARLDRLELTQVVDADTSSVQRRLFEKYGDPDESETTSSQKMETFGWHEKRDASAGNRSVFLHAALSETGKKKLITSLSLSHQKVYFENLAAISGTDLQL